MLRRHRRQVDELEVDLVEDQHARLGILRRERVFRDRGARSGEPRVQRGLARVGRPDERDLRRALGTDDERGAAARAALLRPLQFLGELLDAALDVGLEMIGPLVLGDRAQHLVQPVEPLARIARFPERGLRRLVLGAQVCRHRDRRAVTSRGRGNRAAAAPSPPAAPAAPSARHRPRSGSRDSRARRRLHRLQQTGLLVRAPVGAAGDEGRRDVDRAAGEDLQVGRVARVGRAAVPVQAALEAGAGEASL